MINNKNDARNVKRAGDPQAMFTFATGGNIVSRGLTFEHLLTFYFSRTVKGQLQQNTYIERARMFGNRIYSRFFELCVPETLIVDWATVFQDHELSLRLAKAAVYRHIQSGRSSVVDGPSLDQNNVTMDKSARTVGEIFPLSELLEDELVNHDRCRPLTFLEQLLDRGFISEDELPRSFIGYLREVADENESDVLIVLRSEENGAVLQNIERYKDGDTSTIARPRGAIVHAMLNKRPEYVNNSHFILPIKNQAGEARFLYKSNIGHTVLQNLLTFKPIG